MTIRAATSAAADLAVNGGSPVSARPVPMISVEMSDDDIAAAVSVMRTKMLAQGKNVLEFEAAFAAMSGSRHALACANGTCALQLAYEPLFEPGDDVLVAAWGYVATGSMIVARGARPVFVEVDPVTYCIDMRDAAKRITPRTTAIVATHLYGNVADIDAVEAFAVEHGLSVVYDAAQAHAARYKGRGVGEFGDAVTYSFYPTKNITTGEGGMVTTNDADLDRKFRLLRSHGETQKYLHEQVGYNYRMTDVEAAVGVSQMKRLGQLTARRQANARRLDAAIAEIDGLHAPTPTAGAEHVYHLYPVRMDAGAFTCSRDEFCAALKAEGVPTALHYPRPLTRQPLFGPMVDDPAAFAISDRLAASLFCVPIHPALTEQELSVVADAIRKVAAAYRA